MDCHLLSHGISIEKSSLHDCCLTHGYNGRPFIIELNENKSVDWQEFFKLKQKLKEEKSSSEKECKGCRLLSENKNYNDGDYISHINLNHWNICNSRCVYCSKEYNGGNKYFNVLPMIKDLFEFENGQCINYEGELTFQGGEPTMLPEFDELLTLFTSKKMPVRIHSSGIKYSKAIENGLKNNTVTLVISPDTAIPKTYKRIKRVNCCDKVWNNLQEYVKYQQESNRVKVKFIIIPGYNDDINEIDSFLERAKNIGIKQIVWEIECMYAATYNYDIPHVSMLLDYAVLQTIKNGFNYEFYDGAMYVNNKKSEKIENIENKSDFEKYFESIKLQYKNRNIDYLKLFKN